MNLSIRFHRWVSRYSLIALIFLLVISILRYSPWTIYAQAETSQSLTKQFTDSVNAYNRPYLLKLFLGSPTSTQLKTQAQRRKQKLLEEVEQTPDVFFKNKVPSDLRKTLPPDINTLLEQDVETHGILRVTHGDNFAKRESKFFYRLESDDKKNYSLYFSKKEPHVLSGATVKVKGISLDTVMVVESPSATPQQDSASYTLSVEKSPVPGPTGVQNYAVLLIKFQNSLNADPVTQAQVQDMLFTNTLSVSAFYQENSYQKVSLGGTVYGWYTIPYDNTGNCSSNYYTWATAADSAARAAGVSIDGFNRRMYIFSNPQNCSYGGLGDINGTPSRTWIFNYFTTRAVYAHEVGHNFGVHHANLLYCSGKSIDVPANCQSEEYEDIYDVMGNFWYVLGYQSLHFNGPHKIAENWLPSANVQTLTQSGTYTVLGLESSSTNTQVLKIPKQNTNEYYYVEFRQPSGFDSVLPTSATQGVLVHTWNGNPAVQTQLIDTTPQTYHVRDEALVDGATFSDPINGIAISQVGHTPSSATVQVTVPQASFSNLSSTLVLNSATFNFTYSGSSNNYIVDLSTIPDMSWDVYLTFSQGTKSPIIENNPTKWDKYSCGTTLYWRVRSAEGIQSPIQTATVTCPTGTPSPTPTTTITPTPTNTPTGTPTPTPTPFVQVLYPNGGEVFTTGETVNIRWNASLVITSVYIYSVDTLNTFRTIANSITNSGTYTWVVDKGNTINTQFKIYLLGNPASKFDYSDNYFTILIPSTPTPSPTPTNTPTPTSTPTPSPTPTPISCKTSDINKDGFVNSQDRALLLADYLLASPTSPRSDINKDGIVDLADYALLVIDYDPSSFLQGCQ